MSCLLHILWLALPPILFINFPLVTPFTPPLGFYLRTIVLFFVILLLPFSFPPINWSTYSLLIKLANSIRKSVLFLPFPPINWSTYWLLIKLANSIRKSVLFLPFPFLPNKLIHLHPVDKIGKLANSIRKSVLFLPFSFPPINWSTYILLIKLANWQIQSENQFSFFLSPSLQ